MATGSYMTPIYSRSQSEILGDLHRLVRRKPILPRLKSFRQKRRNSEGPSKNFVPELLPAIAALNAEKRTQKRCYFEGTGVASLKWTLSQNSFLGGPLTLYDFIACICLGPHIIDTAVATPLIIAGVHYRLFSVWTLVPVRLDQQLSDHSTVDEIASGAADCHLTYTMVGKTGRKKGRKREREKEGKRARKRQGLVVLGSGEENPRVLFGDADQESETRMSKNALRTGRRQAVE
ncbi:hypothetical protein TNCV_4115611 [Trichonephila clavipes]|nr:hypothetical protein TNCV_4115611 [Trichonephila clavipes]